MDQYAPFTDIRRIPFLDHTALTADRTVGPFYFYANKEWQCWIHDGTQFFKMKLEPAQSSYFGDDPAKDTDWSSDLLNLIRQRISFPTIDRAAAGIWNDFQNLATSLAKIHLFFEESLSRKDITRFAQTEVEYILLVCRSVFDLLQEIITDVWERIKLDDPPAKKRSLPESFNDVLYHSNAEQSAEQITAKYGIPLLLSQWYVDQRPFFARLKQLRDKMAHRGSEVVHHVFSTERGFAVGRDDWPWSEFHQSPPEVELPNKLVPLRPILCAIIMKTFDACDSFACLLEHTIGLPKPLYPGFTYFSRGYADRDLNSIPRVVENSLWCYQVHPVTGSAKPWYRKTLDWIAEEWRKTDNP